MEWQINGKTLPPVAIGTWAWGGGANGSKMIFGSSTEENVLNEVFQTAYQNGFTLWDTAAVYGMGTSEKILSKCMGEKEVILSTKYTPTGKFNSKAIDEMLTASTERMNGRIPDIYWLHSPNHIDENLNYFCKLMLDGKIRSIGVSNFNLEQVKQAEKILAAYGFKLGGVQNHYSLIYRNSERAGVLNWCVENNVPFFAYMVLEQSALSGRYNSKTPFPIFSRRGMAFTKSTLKKLEPLHETLKTIGNKHGLSIADTAVAWAISKNTVPIIGVTKPYQAEALNNIKGIILTDDEITALESAAAETGAEKKGIWEPKI